MEAAVLPVSRVAGGGDGGGGGGGGGWEWWKLKLQQLGRVEAVEAAVAHLCNSYSLDDLDLPSLWKLIHQSLSTGHLSTLHLLSLLTSRLLPLRRSLPHSFHLYLHLLSLHALSPLSSPCCLPSVDAALRLSHSFNFPVTHLSHAFVFFFFTILSSLLDSALDDFGFPSPPVSIPSHTQLLAKNPFTTLEVLAQLTETRKAKFLLRLVCLNM